GGEAQELRVKKTGATGGCQWGVWVKQPTGQCDGRPAVKGFYRTWKGQRWLRGNVPTGGYEDQMWLHAEQRDGRSEMHVFIRHQSLDSKPSSQSEYWFVKTGS